MIGVIIGFFSIILSPKVEAETFLERECQRAAFERKKTQGAGECRISCFAKYCGISGLRCPTVEQKDRIRAFCDSHCIEQSNRQRELERLLEFCREMAAEKLHAELALKRIRELHRLWMEKKKLIYQLKIQYQKAKMRAENHNQVSTQQLERLREELSQIALQKMREKEKFYLARLKMREREIAELKRQLAELKLRLKKIGGKNQNIESEVKRRERELSELEKIKRKLKRYIYQNQYERSNFELKELSKKEQSLIEKKRVLAKSKKELELKKLAEKMGKLAAKKAKLKSQKEKLRKLLQKYASFEKKNKK